MKLVEFADIIGYRCSIAALANMTWYSSRTGCWMVAGSGETGYGTVAGQGVGW